jgi:L-alanine-DL-glutamate epimerase-like enolase superfamily enzyme
VRARLRCDVAAGEYSWTEDDTRRLCEAGAVDCVQLDATRCGGVTGFLQGAALAAAAHLEVSAHCAPYLHAALCASLPNLRHVEYFHDHQRIESRLFTGTAPPTGGLLPIPTDGPGLGLNFQLENARDYAHRG